MARIGNEARFGRFVRKGGLLDGEFAPEVCKGSASASKFLEVDMATKEESVPLVCSA